MEYNSQRSRMNISEYGRNIQKMIEHIMTIEDREKRNELTRATIQVMGQLNPHLRDVSDFKHKLWDHLFIMSNFKLDVDSPYPIPSAETLTRKPQRLKYAANHIKFRHYGRHIQDMVNQAIAFEEGEEKDALIRMIANHLKKSYLTWNRDSVTDEQIANDLSRISGGKLELKSDIKLSNTQEILSKSMGVANIKKRKNPGHAGHKHNPSKGHFSKGKKR